MSKKIKVLVVDDDKSILKSAKMYLNKFDVITAASGKDALEVVKNNEVDVIVSDYNMPKLNGLEFTNALKQKKSIIPVIIMSGQLTNQVSMDFANLHVFFIIEKPFLFEKLVEQIDLAYESKENAIQTQKLSIIGRESAHIIHDLNNSLAIIEGSSDIGLLHTKEPFLKRQFERTVRACNNIKNMVSTYKVFLNSSNSINFTPVNLVTYCEDFSLELKLTYPAVNIVFENRTNRGEAYSLINENILTQVLLNLISNSIYAIKDTQNPWIKISVEHYNSKNILKIIDSGEILPEIQDRLFKQNISNKGSGGTGMGLIYCKELCEKMYGSICFDTNENNTCFKIEFVSNMLDTD